MNKLTVALFIKSGEDINEAFCKYYIINDCSLYCDLKNCLFVELSPLYKCSHTYILSPGC